MLTSAIVAYLHYLSLILAVGGLVTETLTLNPTLTLRQGWRIVIADSVYGIAALGILSTGVLRLLYFGQGSEFYTTNPVFWIKMGLFIIVGLLSLYPTVSFIFWIPRLRQAQIPDLTESRVTLLQWLIRAELVGFGLIPLFAAMMARGIGLAV